VRSGAENALTDVPGIAVGHAEVGGGLSGTTVVLAPPDGAVAGVDVRGGSPGTRETDLLDPRNTIARVHAVVLSGGSAFGLAAADGVMARLEAAGIGFAVAEAVVPIVPAAVLFDLGLGDPTARPDEAAGYAACEAAASGGDVEEGSVGAGAGATFAKQPDPEACWKGGLGTAAVEEGDRVVAALAAVNALGTVLGEDGEPIVENRNPQAEPRPWPGTNTTLVVVATNARLTKDRAQLLAQAGSEGVSTVVSPAHTMWDGDTVFAIATGEVEAPQRDLEAMAAQAVAEAIRRGVRSAGSLGGVPAVGESRGDSA
jgi:L-aminopeptidase/D-esterase-like protein